MTNSYNGHAEQSVVARAVQLHQMGHLPEAERLYVSLLGQNSKHFVALHMLGVIRLTQGDAGAAISLIGKALAVDPLSPEATANYGNALLHARKFKDAIIYFEKALGMGVRHPEVLANLGCALLEIRRPKDALVYFDKALAIKPSLLEALNNKTSILLQLGETDAALSVSEKARVLAPHSLEMMNNRGAIFLASKRVDEALAIFDQALSLNPNAAPALNNRATALRLLARHEEAMDCCERALNIDRKCAEVWVTKGNILRDLRRFSEALTCYDHALGINPSLPEALTSRSDVLNQLEQFDLALQSCNEAIKLRPQSAEAFNNRGVALMSLKQLNEAEASFDSALKIVPEYAEACVNKGVSLMLGGDFERGLRLYEWRKRLPMPIDFRSYPQPVWTGVEDIFEKRLFLYAVQGIGDTIQFARYLALARNKGARVILSVRPSLHRLLRYSFPGVELIAPDDRPDDFDYYNALTSMALAFWSVEPKIPTFSSYLEAESDLSEYWSSRIGKRGFKIGIAWQGNPAGKIDVGRSFPVCLLEAIGKMHNVRLISLQKNDGVDQLDALPEGMKVETLGDALDGRADAFIDTAAAMQSLDLVITSDTAIAHLAGALGKPVWMALKYFPDWRWMVDGTGSPWYPTVRLFRQKSVGEWSAVFNEMKTVLAEMI